MDFVFEWAKTNPFTVLIILYLGYMFYQRSQPFPDENEGPTLVKDIAQWEALLKSGKVVVCDYYATWCPPCKVAAPIYHKLSEDPIYADNVVFVKCNVDSAKAVAQACKISSMPTFKVFKGGVECGSMSGWNEAKLRGFIDGAVPSKGPAVAQVPNVSKKD